MDVGRVAGSAANLSLEKTLSSKNVEWAEDTFMPEKVPPEESECTLHISDEGYRRWEQSRQNEECPTAGELPSAENAVSADSVDESEKEDEMSSIERLCQFADRLRDVIKNTKRQATKETDDEKVAALEQLRQLKEEQEEEYQRQVKEAQVMASRQTKTKNIVEKGMRDLTIMLESFKSMDDDKKEDKAQAADKDTDSDKDTDTQQEKLVQKTEDEDLPGNREEMHGFGDRIRRHAFRAELSMDGTINAILERAQNNLRYARNGARTLRERLSAVYTEITQNGDVSDADKDKTVNNFLEGGSDLLEDVEWALKTGLERLYNLREINRARYDNQNMVYAQRAQDAIGEIADQSVLDGLYQEGYESMEGETIEELAKHIRDLLEEERMSRTEDAEETEETDNADGIDKADSSESAKKLAAADDSEDTREA